MVENLLLLVNPVSGNKNNIEIAIKIEKHLKPYNWRIYKLINNDKTDLINFLTKVNLNEFTKIGIVGGDGTLHEVINLLLNKKENCEIPILLFPCGTGNAFNYDLNCLTVEKALDRLLQNNTKKIDVMVLKANNKTKIDVVKLKENSKIEFAFSIIGFGIVNDINMYAEKLRWFGAARYNIASILEIFKNKHYFATIKVDEQIYEGDFCFVLICNTIHTGKAMKIAPNASLNDGLLDVLIVKRLSIWQLLSLFPKIFSGAHIQSPLVTYIKAKNIEITPQKPQIGNLDGEIKGISPFIVEVLPSVLHVVC